MQNETASKSQRQKKNCLNQKTSIIFQPGEELNQLEIRHLFAAKQQVRKVCHSAFSLHKNAGPKQNNREKKTHKRNINPNIPVIKFYLLNSGILEAKLLWTREVHCKM